MFLQDRLSQIITSLRMHDVSNEKRYECDVDDTMLNDLKEVTIFHWFSLISHQIYCSIEFCSVIILMSHIFSFLQFLALEHKAIRELKDVLQSDLADMKLMEEELRRFQSVQAS